MTLPARGFSLLELAIALAVIGALTAGALGVASLTAQRSNYNEAAQTLVRVERAIITYVEANWRLPCPDTSQGDNFDAIGTGIEGNCAAALGQVPYRALGFSEPPLDPWNRPLAFAIDGRLTVNNAYRYRFCQRLRIFAEDPVAVDYLHSAHMDGSDSAYENLAYVVLSGGARDVTGSGSRVDQLRATASTQQLQIDDYVDGGFSDDRYAAASLLAFSGRLRCPGAMVSVNSIENEVIAASLTYDNLLISIENVEGAIDGIGREITLGALQIVQGSVGVASATASLINAIGQGLSGNVPAKIAAAAAVAGAAGAVVAIAGGAVAIADAIISREELRARLAILNTYTGVTSALCAAAEAEVIAAKGSSFSCP